MSVMAPDDSLPDGLSDEALLAGMAAGAVAAGTAFVRRHQSRVFGLAWVLVGDPGLAEDVAQETFLRAWLHGASFDARKGSVRSWLCTITRNLAIDTLRMHRAEPVDPDALLAQLALADGDPCDHVTRFEDAELVRAAVRELPAPQRRARVLARWCGRTAADSSTKEPNPRGTATTRIRTAAAGTRAGGLLWPDRRGDQQNGADPAWHREDPHPHRHAPVAVDAGRGDTPVSEMDCAAFQEAAAELALGILTGPDRAAALARPLRLGTLTAGQ